VGATAPRDFCWNSGLGSSGLSTAVSFGLQQRVGAVFSVQLPSSLPCLMELSSGSATKKRWGLALSVLRLRHRALRVR